MYFLSPRLAPTHSSSVPSDPFFKLYQKHAAPPAEQNVPAPAPQSVSQSWEDYIQQHAQHSREEYVAWIESEVDEFRIFNLYPRTPEERAEWIDARLASYLVPARTQLEARFERQRTRLERSGATPEQILRFEKKCDRERTEFEASALKKVGTWRADLVPLWEIIPPTTEEEVRDRYIG